MGGGLGLADEGGDGGIGDSPKDGGIGGIDRSEVRLEGEGGVDLDGGGRSREGKLRDGDVEDGDVEVGLGLGKG